VGVEDFIRNPILYEKIYKQLFSGNPFLYAFEDETFAAQYRNDRRFAGALQHFAALAIFIAVWLLGWQLHGRQRTKEIGIRRFGGYRNQLVALTQ